jgi:general secretion pathway protein J
VSHVAHRRARRRAAVRVSRRRGVTLIEVMVAMTIIAIVSTLLYTGFTQTASNKKRVESEMERHHEIRMGLERIARDLSMAFVSAQINPNTALQTVKTAFVGKDSGGGSRVDFTAFAHQRLYRDAHESDQCEIAYFMTDDPKVRGKDALARREQARIDDDPLDGGKGQVLIHDVESFELEYLDPTSGEWLSTWDTTQGAMQPNRLPSQVRISVTVANVRGKGRSQTFATRASLPLQYALNHATYRK